MNNSSTNFKDADRIFWAMSILTASIIANFYGLMRLNVKIRRLTLENVFTCALLLNNLMCCFVVGPQYLKGTPYNCVFIELSVNYWVITNMFIVLMISIDQFYVTMDERHEHLMVDVFKMVKTLIFMSVLVAVAMVAIIFTPYPSPGVWSLCTVNKPYVDRPLALRVVSSCIVVRFFCACLFVIGALNIYISQIYGVFLVRKHKRVPGDSYLESLWKTFAEIAQTSKPVQVSYSMVVYCTATQFPAATLQHMAYVSDIPILFLLLGVLFSPYLLVFNNRQQITGERCTYFTNPMQGTWLQNNVLQFIQTLVQPQQ